MPVFVESRTDAEPERECLALPPVLANRPHPDWQGPALQIRHQVAEWRGVERARVSTTQVGDQ